MTKKIEQKLTELRIKIPETPQPAGNYIPFIKNGDLYHFSGVAPSIEGKYAVVGKVGKDLTEEDGYRAARICALNFLANLKTACSGDLNRVQKIVMVRGFVNAAESFEKVPQVINGASDLILKVFGKEKGQHARTSIGCSTLPSRVAVEIDVLARIKAE